MSGQKYQTKEENDWMQSSCLTNNVTSFCYNFLLKFKFAAATKQEAFFFCFEAKIRKNATSVKIEKNFSKTLLQCNGKLISYATIFLCLGKSETYWTYQQSFLPSSSKLILYERYFWVWVKVKHIEPIKTFFSKPIQRFSEKNCKDAQEKFVC